MLGGHTATIAEGRVTQFGPTQECYRAPVDLTTARVFSDPPINAAPVEKRGGEIVLLDRVRWPAAGAAARDPRRPLHPRAPPALRHAAPRAARPRCRSHGRRADHRALRLRERRPLRRRRHDLGRAVERRPSLPGRRHPRLLPRRRPRPLLRRRRPEGRLMARIGLKNLRHSYIAHPRGPDDYALKTHRPRVAGRRRLRAARPLRLRQDDAAQHHLRPDRALRGPGPLRRPRRHPPRRRPSATSPRSSSSRSSTTP